MKLARRYLSASVPLGIIAALIIWTTLLVISRAFTSLPYYDSWGLYPDPVQSLKFLFHAHNEHIIATIKLFFWIDRYLTSSSGFFIIGLIFVSCAIPALIIVTLVRKHSSELATCRDDDTALALGLLCIGYASVQFTNLVWQFQIGFLSAYTLALTALGCQAISTLTFRRTASWTWLAVAIIFATLASYGLFGGTLVWPAMVALAWFARRKRQLVVILLTGAIVAIPYVINFIGALPNHGIGEGKVVKFLLAWLGSPVAGLLDTTYLGIGAISVRTQVGVAALFGLLTLLAFAWFSWRITPMLHNASSDNNVLLLLPLWLFCWIIFVSGLLAAIGRSYLPLNEAISSRYTTPPLMLWACMAGLWLQLARMKKASLRFFKPALLTVSFLILASQPNRVFQADMHGARMAQAESAILNEVSDPSALAGIYPTPKTIIPHIASLKAAKVSIFRPGVWPALGANTQVWRTVSTPCKVTVFTQTTSYGKTFWRAELAPASLDHSWRIVYTYNQQVMGLGIPEDHRGIQPFSSKTSHWIGYGPSPLLASKAGTFKIVSIEHGTASVCKHDWP